MSTRVRDGRVAPQRAAPPSESDVALEPWQRIGGLEVRTAEQSAVESAAIAVFGKTGSGKTAFAATALDWASIKVKRMFWIDCDGGLRTVRGRGDQIAYVPVTSYADGLKVIGGLAAGGGKHFGAICLDTGSELADLAMEVTLEKQGKEEPDWLSWRDNSRMYITQVVRPLRNIGRKYGIPVIFTFWEREETNDAGSVRAIHADLNPALRKLMLAAVDLACWEEVLPDDTSRALHVSTTRRTDAKFRLDMSLEADRSIPPYIYNPSLATILDTIVDGKVWPAGAHAFPEGLSPRFARRPEAPPKPASTRKEENRRRGE